MSKPFDMELFLLLANVVRHDRISREVGSKQHSLTRLSPKTLGQAGTADRPDCNID
jgi:hypothetical protein